MGVNGLRSRTARPWIRQLGNQYPWLLAKFAIALNDLNGRRRKGADLCNRLISTTDHYAYRFGSMQNAYLLPEDQWKLCERCKTAVPEFEFSAPFEVELRGLLKSSPAWATARLMQETQCNLSLAKAWIIHHVASPLNEHPPCPHCSKPLRTSKARQCRFCSRDWH